MCFLSVIIVFCDGLVVMLGVVEIFFCELILGVIYFWVLGLRVFLVEDGVILNSVVWEKYDIIILYVKEVLINIKLLIRL